MHDVGVCIYVLWHITIFIMNGVMALGNARAKGVNMHRFGVLCIRQ